jgi:hypothetical protein
VIYKTGRTTGTTYGTITATCVTAFESGTALLCADEADSAAMGEGDSGSPIFYPPDTLGDPPYAIGILSSGGGTSVAYDGPAWYCTTGCYLCFTEFETAETHLSRYFTP